MWGFYIDMEEIISPYEKVFPDINNNNINTFPISTHKNTNNLHALEKKSNMEHTRSIISKMLIKRKLISIV